MSRARPSATSAGARNPGRPLEAGWIAATRVDAGAVQVEAAALQAAADRSGAEAVRRGLQAVAMLDLTTLAPDDTVERVAALCARARDPLGAGLEAALGVPVGSVHAATVCVAGPFVRAAAAALAGSPVGVCAVAAGFPSGQGSLAARSAEIPRVLASGAQEVDVVIQRAHALEGNWAALYDEVRAFRAACGAAPMKVILGTGELDSPTTIARTSLVAMMAGADFVKTSTGKEAVNATLPAGLAMAVAIRAYRERTGHAVGLKPAGGLARARDAFAWLDLVEGTLGTEWLHPTRLRFGASRLLDDLVATLRAHAPAP